MDTKTGVNWVCPVTDDELRAEALRRWKRGDRDVEGDISLLGDAFVRRQYVLDEIRKLSEPSKAARLRVRRMYLRMQQLESMVEQAKRDCGTGDITPDRATALITRICLDILPNRKLVFWATCAATKQVREAYKAQAARVEALWEEFWSLGQPSVQAEQATVGDRDASAMWGGVDVCPECEAGEDMDTCRVCDATGTVEVRDSD